MMMTSRTSFTKRSSFTGKSWPCPRGRASTVLNAPDGNGVPGPVSPQSPDCAEVGTHPLLRGALFGTRLELEGGKRPAPAVMSAVAMAGGDTGSGLSERQAVTSSAATETDIRRALLESRPRTEHGWRRSSGDDNHLGDAAAAGGVPRRPGLRDQHVHEPRSEPHADGRRREDARQLARRRTQGALRRPGHADARPARGPTHRLGADPSLVRDRLRP